MPLPYRSVARQCIDNRRASVRQAIAAQLWAQVVHDDVNHGVTGSSRIVPQEHEGNQREHGLVCLLLLLLAVASSTNSAGGRLHASQRT